MSTRNPTPRAAQEADRSSISIVDEPMDGRQSAAQRVAASPSRGLTTATESRRAFRAGRPADTSTFSEDTASRRSRVTNDRLEVRPTLIVGVGGTGSLAVKHVKKRILEISRNKPVPFMRFVVFDTTVEDSAVVKLDEGEFVNIGQLDFNEIVQNIREYRHLISWFPYDKFKPMQLGLGAMGVRHIGRLCYFQWRESPRVRELVMSRIQELMNPSLPDKIRECGHITDLRVEQRTGIDIHLIGSGAGGTGSGMFLDVAYDLRQWAKNIAKSARIIGHMVLPDAFEGLVPEPVMPQIESNSYALLSEIDHFVGNGGWEAAYKNETVRTNESPFDLIYLLGRNSMDGAARTRTELVAIVGNTIANLSLSAAGKDLVDTAVNLIPPILSGTDEKHHKPCPYASYGLCIATADRDEIAREGSVEVARRILESLVGRGPEGHARMQVLAGKFLEGIPLTVEEFQKLRPEPPTYQPAAQPTGIADAEILRENQHLPKLEDAARNQRKTWEETLKNRFAAASGRRLLSEMKHLLAAKDGVRMGELVDFADALVEEFQKRAQWCDECLQELERETAGAGGQIQELRARRSLPDNWLKIYSELVAMDDRRRLEGEYLSRVRELCLEVARELETTVRRTFESFHEILGDLRDQIETRLADPEELEVPYCRFVGAKEALGALLDDLSRTAGKMRQLLADLLDEGPKKTHERINALSSALEHIAHQAVQTTLADYSIGDQLDLHRLSLALERRDSDLLRMKLKNVYNLSQPAIRCREEYPKEKIVTSGRVTSVPWGPSVKFLRTLDGNLQGISEEPSNMAVLRFVYGLPLWAVDGVSKWERIAVDVQTSQQTVHNFLDPRWAELIQPLVPKPTTFRENLWLFTMAFALGRIRKPVETFEIDGERLRGVKERARAAEEFEKRLENGSLSRAELEDQVEDRLQGQGDHAAQLEFLERHLAQLAEKLEREHGAAGSRDDAKLLRDEILVLKEHIARKRKDL